MCLNSCCTYVRTYIGYRVHVYARTYIAYIHSCHSLLIVFFYCSVKWFMRMIYLAQLLCLWISIMWTVLKWVVMWNNLPHTHKCTQVIETCVHTSHICACTQAYSSIEPILIANWWAILQLLLLNMFLYVYSCNTFRLLHTHARVHTAHTRTQTQVHSVRFTQVCTCTETSAPEYTADRLLHTHAQVHIHTRTHMHTHTCMCWQPYMCGFNQCPLFHTDTAGTSCNAQIWHEWCAHFSD